MNRFDFACGLSDLDDYINDRETIELVKMLESFKQECETFGIYEEGKTLAEMREQLNFLKDQTFGRYLQ